MTYQGKILTTAVLSVVMLNKKLSGQQWVSLLMLRLTLAAAQVLQRKWATRVERPMDDSRGSGKVRGEACEACEACEGP